MAGSKKMLLFLSAGGMELCWLYALSAPLFLLVNAPLFPPREAVVSFCLAAALASFLKNRGRRIIEHIVLHLLLGLAVALWSLYLYGGWEGPFLSSRWLELLLGGRYSYREGFILALVPFWGLAFWLGGLTLARRSTGYFHVTARFDLGVAALALTFIIVAGAGLSFPHGVLLIVAFFLFGMNSIALAREARDLEAGGLFQFHGAGMVTAFAVAVLIFGTGALIFFLPQLTRAAGNAYMMLEGAARPVGSFLTGFLTFLFSLRFRGAVEESQAGTDLPGVGGGELTGLPWWASLIERVLSLGAAGLLALFILAAAGWALWRTCRWLLTRTPVSGGKRSFPEALFIWLAGWIRRCKNLLHRAARFLRKKRCNGSTVFLRLSHWGRFCGIPRRISETPREYANCLSSRFPAAETEIRLIVETFNREAYGKKLPDREQLRQLKRAWRRLCSPLLWPPRLRARLFSPR